MNFNLTKTNLGPLKFRYSKFQTNEKEFGPCLELDAAAFGVVPLEKDFPAILM